jgi:hypothetical protein
MASEYQLRHKQIYVSSFLKTNGTDSQFICEFPSQVITQISLQSAVIDNWYPNLYDTTGKNFSEFGLGVLPVIRCDVYISSLDEFVLWFNGNSPRYKLSRSATPSYMKIFKF